MSDDKLIPEQESELEACTQVLKSLAELENVPTLIC